MNVMIYVQIKDNQVLYVRISHIKHMCYSMYQQVNVS